MKRILSGARTSQWAVLSVIGALLIAAPTQAALSRSIQTAPQTALNYQTTPAPIVLDGFEIQTIVPKIDRPTTMAFASKNRIFVALKNGVIRILRDGWLDPTLVADLRNEVSEQGDRGLTGMVLDPNFDSNGYLYLSYIYDAPGEAPDSDQGRSGKVVRFTLKDDVLDPSSAMILADGFRDLHPSHGTGALRFDWDGNLLASFGDGSNSIERTDDSLRAQNLDLLNGKLIRMDPKTGCGVKGNPFFDSTQPCATRSKIWAFGLRYPYRLSVQADTKSIYVGDVGWNTYEMVRKVYPGANYGWPCFEGPNLIKENQEKAECQKMDPRLISKSDYVYNHNGGAAAIIGGALNNGDDFPADMKGDYFFADYSLGYIRHAKLDSFGHIKMVYPFAANVGSPDHIEFGPDGALYILTIFPSQIKRISYQPSNRAPVAAFSLTSTQGVSQSSATTDNIVGMVPYTVVLDASASFDPDGKRLTFKWNTGEAAPTPGVKLNQKSLTQVYQRPGRYFARVTVSDAKGWYTTASKTLYLTDGSASKTALVTAPLTDKGYIRTWWLEGNYPNAPLSTDVFAASPWRWAGGEAAFFGHTGLVSETLLQSTSDRIDLGKAIIPNSNNLTYAFIWIEADAAKDGMLGISADDGVAIWLNGEEIWRNSNKQAVSETEDTQDHIRIHLEKGLNPLLVKVVQQQDDWAFKIRLLTEDWKVLPGIQVRTQIN